MTDENEASAAPAQPPEDAPPETTSIPPPVDTDWIKMDLVEKSDEHGGHEHRDR
jgi:hypothetical protein